jgi:ParB family chromosome partitioning protein
MTQAAREGEDVREIAIAKIEILNPRERNQKVFREIVASIKALGLKKPITVARRGSGEAERYVLVCGQGRVEAFMALGQTTIPALVLDATDEDAFVLSLVENIARRQTPPAELLETIRTLQQRGYDVATIAAKTALEQTWVKGVLTLLNQGEERLISAVERGRIPLNIAIAIAEAEGGDVQEVLQESYESGALRGKKLLAVRRLVERRQHIGKGFERRATSGPRSGRLTTAALVRTYNQEVERQKLLIRKADLVQQRLAFIIAAMSSMLSDENFANLLRAESLHTLPRQLDERVRSSTR